MAHATNQNGQGAVEISDVSKTFEQDTGQMVTVFDGIDCSIRPGEFVSLLGPSGCGKSTLLRMVAGLSRADRGSVQVDGVEVTKPPGTLGMVFQDDCLLEWRTVLDNVMLAAVVKKIAKDEAMPRAMELLGRVGLGEFAEARPSQLSGGMKQRTAICQALLHRPKLLLMDEPFGALDALTREQMQADLETLWQTEQSTVLFVTHSISEAVLLSDRVLVFSNRPARILTDLQVDLPRPRNSDTTSSPAFIAYTKQIYQLFRQEGVLR